MISKGFASLNRFGHRTKYIICILITVAIGISDYITGYEVSFSIFYLIPVSLASWYLGIPSGRQMAFLSAAAWLIVDYSSGHPYSNTVILFWNAVVRMGFFLITAQLLAALHDHMRREEKDNERLAGLVEERTHELRIANENLKQEIMNRKLAEAEVIRSNQLAALGEMAAGVAHEINNPINGIINYAQILADDKKTGDEGRDICGRIIKESSRIADIVRSLLSFSRDSKKEKHAVNIREIITDSVALTGAYLRKDGIDLKVDIAPDIPEIIANRQQVQQVFLNLVSNARYALNQKYTSTDKDKILEVAAREVTVDNHEYLRITFHDHGTGISENIIDKVMNPFFTTKPDSIGTGLGLSISHGIIKEHGGDLKLESREGEFTKVVIELPLKVNNSGQRNRVERPAFH